MRIMLIDEDGKKISNSIDINEAQEIAKGKEKDLVLVNEKNRVYRIADSGKLKYEKKQKERRIRAQRRTQKIKEIQIRPNIDVGDLEIKINRIKKFLDNGLKTRLVMRFKRKELTYRNIGMDKVKEIVADLVSNGLATTDGSPRFEGNSISVFLIPPIPVGK